MSVTFTRRTFLFNGATTIGTGTALGLPNRASCAERLFADPADPTGQRATRLLELFGNLFFPLTQPLSSLAIDSERAFVALSLNRSKEMISAVNTAITRFLTPFVSEQYWVASNGDDLRFYWQQTLFIKLLLQDDLKARLTPENISLIKNLLWNFLVGFNDEDSKFGLGSADATKIRDIHGSDNHDMIRHGFFLFATQILKEDLEYAKRKLPDGLSVSDSYERWIQNLLLYFPAKARIGIQAEVGSPTYIGPYLTTLFVIADHAGDLRVRTLASSLLDLIFADAGQETLNGIRGGARSRAYKIADGYDNLGDNMLLPIFVLTGTPATGALSPLQHLPPKGCLSVLATSYRLPHAIAEFFTSRAAMGSFQYDNNRPATGRLQNVSLRDSLLPIYSPDQLSHYVRSTWVTPNYVLGWFTIDESRPALLLHDQNEEICAVTSVATGRMSLTGIPTSADHRTSYSDFQCVGAGGVVLVRTSAHVQHPRGFRLYLSSDFVVQSVGSWLVARAGDERSWLAFQALTLPSTARNQSLFETNWAMDVPGRKPQGHFFQTVPNARLAILGGDVSNGTFEQFLYSFSRAQITLSDESLSYSATDSGRSLTLFADARVPCVDHKPVALPPARVFSSPFLKADVSGRRFTVRSPTGANTSIDF